MAGLNIQGSLNTDGGNVAGRDLFNIVINIVKESRPQGDPLPKELEKTLDDLDVLITTLHGWKEVHNSLDEIRNRFDQYRELIENSNNTKKVPMVENIRRSWRPAFEKIQLFNKRMDEVVSVEQQFSSRNFKLDVSRKNNYEDCRNKTITLVSLAYDINIHCKNMNNGDTYVDRLNFYEYIIFDIKLRIGNNYWWNHMVEMTDQLHSNLTESMFLTDKILRTTAGQLYEFSQAIFGNQRN